MLKRKLYGMFWQVENTVFLFLLWVFTGYHFLFLFACAKMKKKSVFKLQNYLQKRNTFSIIILSLNKYKAVFIFIYVLLSFSLLRYSSPL